MCSAGGVMMEITNSGRTDAESFVSCSIRNRPIYGFSPKVRALISDPDKRVYVLANVECSVYPHGKGGAADVGSLREALESLRRSLPY
jgi:hypothetical protein